METKVMNLWFNAKIEPIKPLNDTMTLAKCYVLSLGKNNNGSNFNREVVEEALKTIYNIPVTGHLYVDEDGKYRMGDHNMVLQKDKDGNYQFKFLTVPFGVVPENSNIHFEDITDGNGKVQTYLVTDIILWTGKYPDLLEAVYSDKIYFGQSMEIRVEKYSKLSTKGEDSKFTNIDQFSFLALCLLGKSDSEEYNYQPCFPEAKVEPYTFTRDGEYIKLVEEFKQQLAECYSASYKNKEDEEKMTNEVRDAILAKFELNLEQLNFEIIDSMSVEEFEQKVQDVKNTLFANNAKPTVEPITEPTQVNNTANGAEPEATVTTPVEPITEPHVSTSAEFSLSYNKLRDLLYEYVKTLWVYTVKKYGDGVEYQSISVDYWLSDFNDSYMFLTKYIYAPSETNGEKATTYWRKAYKIVDNNLVIGDEPLEEMFVEWITKEEQTSILNAREQMTLEFNELKTFKDNTIIKEKEKNYAAILAEFAELSEDEEFKQLISDNAFMGFENESKLKEKCFAIEGRIRHSVEKPTAPVSKVYIRNTLENGDVYDPKNKKEIYNAFFQKYLPKS